MPQSSAELRPSGLPYALGAHLIWGLMPLYLRQVHSVPVLEFVGWRVIFTLPCALLFIALRGQGSELRVALGNRRILLRLLISAVFVASNWLIYVLAIQSGQVLAASFGYYVTPLLQVGVGALFLHEKLTIRQWGAVALAALGVSVLGWDQGGMLWLSLGMALSWLGYGLVRKVTPVGSLPGLTIETLVLLPFALALLGWHAATPAGLSLGQSGWLDLMIVCAGPMTAVPLTFFAIAARRMDFSALGMFQFSSPTIVFFLGLWVFGQPLDPLQLGAFALIWTAIAVFVWDLLTRRQTA